MILVGTCRCLRGCGRRRWGRIRQLHRRGDAGLYGWRPAHRRRGRARRRRWKGRRHFWPRHRSRGGRLELGGLCLSRPGDCGRRLLVCFELGDAGLQLLDLLAHGGEIARHRLDQFGRFRGLAGGGGRHGGIRGLGCDCGRLRLIRRCGLIGRRCRLLDGHGLFARPRGSQRKRRRDDRRPLRDHLLGTVAIMLPAGGGEGAAQRKQEGHGGAGHPFGARWSRNGGGAKRGVDRGRRRCRVRLAIRLDRFGVARDVGEHPVGPGDGNDVRRDRRRVMRIVDFSRSCR